MKKNIILVTGGFDPLHIGHIKYFQTAKSLGDILVVGLNSDEWLDRKKGKYFLDWNNRAAVISELKSVDHIINFDDSDGSAKDAINQCLKQYPEDNIIFANGGDRTEKNIPEMDIINYRLSFYFGVGGEDKMNSSSWILQQWLDR